MKKLLLGVLIGLMLSDAAEFYFMTKFDYQDTLSLDLQVAEFLSAPILITYLHFTKKD